MLSKEQVIWNSHQIPGMMWPSELAWIYDTFKSSKIHLEIGTYCGKSTYVTAHAIGDGEIYTIDNSSEDKTCFNSEWIKKVRTATFDEINKTLCRTKFFSNNSIDLARKLHGAVIFDSIFIDGNHGYAECKADIECWLPLLKNGGIISGHDYWAKHDGVMEAVNNIVVNFTVVPNTRIWHAVYSK